MSFNVKKDKKVYKKLNINFNKKYMIIFFGVVVAVIVLILLFVLFGNNEYDDANVSSVDKGTNVSVSSKEFKKLLENKDNIEEVLTEEYSNGTYISGPVNIDKAYDYIKSIKIIEETEERVDDYYIYYIFRLKDGSVYNIYIEGDYLRFDDKNYKIEAIDIKDDVNVKENTDATAENDNSLDDSKNENVGDNTEDSKKNDSKDESSKNNIQ